MHQNHASYFLRNTLLVVASLISVIGCTSDSKDKASHTYFGGEIVNPKSHKVTIYKDTLFIDSVILDAKNRFLYKFGDEFKPGLYRFSHWENQVAYIEEGDSLLFRVNTMEFDESISFSGFGASKNNLLIDFFLMNEEENDNLGVYYQRSPEDFTYTLDSLRNIRMKKWERFLEKREPSLGFEKVARTSIFYDNFERKEAYPFSHYGKDKLGFIKSLPADFYRFRESVKINDEDLYSSYSMQRYLIRHLDHLAYLKYGHDKPYDYNSYIHNAHEMDIIDSLITSPLIKDRLLRRAALSVIANNNDIEEVERIYERFNKYAKSERLRASMKRRYDNYTITAAGNKIPDQLLVDSEGRINSITANVNATTVLYFWSFNNKQHMDDSHRKIAELRSKYPEIDFLGINTDKDPLRWSNTIKQQNFPVVNEFQFMDTRKALRELSIYVPHKVIIVDKYSRILNSHANLYNVHFETELLEYLNMANFARPLSN
jgi:hypothetical protein